MPRQRSRRPARAERKPADASPGARPAGPRIAGVAAVAATASGPGWAAGAAATSPWPWLLGLLLAAAGLAALGWLAGAARERARLVNELRGLREAARRQQRLDPAPHWRTDRNHRLLHWAEAPAGAEAQDLFAAAGPALAERLQAGQPFAGLRVLAPRAPCGSGAWLLAGEPCHDAEGRFDGFAGRAQPTDGQDACRAAGAALGPALAAIGSPALLALADGDGWQLLLAGAEAGPWQGLAAGARLGPDLMPAAPAAPSQGGVPPPPLPEALRRRAAAWLQGQDEAGDAGADDGHGWLLHRLQAEGRRALLVLQQPLPATPEAASDDGFVFTLTHDLRAPIRVVEGFARIVKEDYGAQLDRVANDHLDRVLGAAARMNGMIDALLTLARLSSQPLARQPVDLSQLAGYVVDDLRRNAPERQAEIEIEPGLQVVGDPTLLRQVLENLLGNAWKYTQRCAVARIALRAENPGRPGRCFVVRDNGAGFDMRQAERLFGLFQRLHSQADFPGHGVGLASVKRIVARHGGQVWAEAETGRGASFYFTLR